MISREKKEASIVIRVVIIFWHKDKRWQEERRERWRGYRERAEGESSWFSRCIWD